MERAGIIAKVDGPTDWVSPLVLVKKKRWQTSYLHGPKENK